MGGVELWAVKKFRIDLAGWRTMEKKLRAWLSVEDVTRVGSGGSPLEFVFEASSGSDPVGFASSGSDPVGFSSAMATAYPAPSSPRDVDDTFPTMLGTVKGKNASNWKRA